MPKQLEVQCHAGWGGLCPARAPLQSAALRAGRRVGTVCRVRACCGAARRFVLLSGAYLKCVAHPVLLTGSFTKESGRAAGAEPCTAAMAESGRAC